MVCVFPFGVPGILARHVLRFLIECCLFAPPANILNGASAPNKIQYLKG